MLGACKLSCMLCNCKPLQILLSTDITQKTLRIAKAEHEVIILYEFGK